MDLVSYERHGAIGVITVDNPPVNALGVGVRQGLLDCLRRGQEDAAATALVIMGAGRTFMAGADIREFGRPPQPPDLHDAIARLEAGPHPPPAAPPRPPPPRGPPGGRR